MTSRHHVSAKSVDLLLSNMSCSGRRWLDYPHQIRFGMFAQELVLVYNHSRFTHTHTHTHTRSCWHIWLKFGKRFLFSLSFTGSQSGYRIDYKKFCSYFSKSLNGQEPKYIRKLKEYKVKPAAAFLSLGCSRLVKPPVRTKRGDAAHFLFPLVNFPFLNINSGRPVNETPCPALVLIFTFLVFMKLCGE